MSGFMDKINAEMEAYQEEVMRMSGPDVQAKVREALANTSPNHPLLKAVHLLLRNMIRIEHMAGRQKGLDEAELRYQVGRESFGEDFQSILLQVHAKMQRTEEKVSGGKEGQ